MYKTIILVAVLLGALYVFSLSRSRQQHIKSIKSITDTCEDIGSSTNPYKQQENLLKNRACVPQPITKELSVDTIENVQVSNDDYIRVTGYLVKYKWEGPESCNCYSHDPHDFDEHIYLGASLDEHVLGHTFVCEITRKASPELRSLNLWNYVGQKVIVEGYAFIDPDHGGSQWRKTDIEVHPVVSISLADN